MNYTILSVLAMLVLFSGCTSGERVTVTGEAMPTKGGFIVGGVYLGCSSYTANGLDCEELRYKNVEVVGYAEPYYCPDDYQNIQCFQGKAFTKVESIRVLG